MNNGTEGHEYRYEKTLANTHSVVIILNLELWLSFSSTALAH